MIVRTWKHRVTLVSIYTICYAVCYILPNFNLLTEAQLIPRSPIDIWVPFAPWTFVIYLSAYLLVTIVILVHDKEFDPLARMAFTGLFIGSFFFYFFPTRYPRPIPPRDISTISTLAMSLVWTLDSPSNCFPSMHVAMAVTFTWAMRNEARWVFWIFLTWCLAIIGSTLTTKQHYFVDILGGLGTFAMSYAIEKYLYCSQAFQRYYERVISFLPK